MTCRDLIGLVIFVHVKIGDGIFRDVYFWCDCSSSSIIVSSYFSLKALEICRKRDRSRRKSVIADQFNQKQWYMLLFTFLSSQIDLCLDFI